MRICLGIAIVFFLLGTPAVGFANDCLKAKELADRAMESEEQLLELGAKYPECGEINYALGNYYYKRNVWGSAYEHFEKAKEYFPTDLELKEVARECKMKTPVSTDSKEALEDALADLVTRSAEGVQRLDAIDLDMEFDFNSADIRPEDKERLDRVAETLRTSARNYKFDIRGHTDNIGTYEFNKKLSLARATAVETYLVREHGLDPKRFQVSGHSFVRPVYTNLTEEGRQKNRRVEFEGRLFINYRD